MNSPRGPRNGDIAWVHALARRLAGDDGDDIAQQTLIVAETAETPSRGWLFGVVRNQWRMHVRSQQRRRAREHVASSTKSAPSPEDEALRGQIAEFLLGALQTLPELDREMLVLRFCEDWNASEIGKKMELPAATVRTRIRRALLKLRARVDAEYGPDDRPWRACVLATPQPRAITTPPGPASGSATASLAVVVPVLVVGVGLGALAWRSGSQSTPTPANETAPTIARTRATAAPPSVPESPPPTAHDVWLRRADELRMHRAERRQNEDSHRPARDAIDDAADELRGLFFAEEGKSAAPLLKALAEQSAESLGDCARAHRHPQGQLRVRARLLAEVGVGAVVESVEVVEDTIDDPDLLECVVESTYTYDFPAPLVAVFKSHDFVVDMVDTQVAARGVVPLDQLPSVLERYPEFRAQLPGVVDRFPGIVGAFAQLIERDPTIEQRIPELAAAAAHEPAPPTD